jgi:cellulose synthase/poly-beta-1,6-N-acetylglucosamine synthase-like glycosyltransferase
MISAEAFTNGTAVVFWACIALLVYAYAAYPVLIWVCSRLFGSSRRAPSTTDPLPTISVVIAAHNEEAAIASRLENLLALEYPEDRLEIIIASDGSTDRTAEIVRRFASSRIHLLDFQVNRGKAAVLNDAVASARGELLLLSDANTMMDPGAALALAKRFSDPKVGIVCGRLILIDAASGHNVDGMYWKYETFLKRAETRLDALLGANGAIYAIRRELFPPLPQRIAVDDFVIPLLAKLNSGSQIMYEAKALAYEETPAEIRAEFSRRSRIGAGGFQSLSLLWPLLNPFRGWIAVAFASHKVLRWVCPFFLVGAVISSAILVADPIYRVALAVQIALYAVAAAGYYSPRTGGLYRVVRLSTMFVAMNLALLAGFFRWASRRQTGAWPRTARTGA